MLNQAGLVATLPYLEDLVQCWIDSGAGAAPWDEAKNACAALLSASAAASAAIAALLAPASRTLVDALLGVHVSPARPGAWRFPCAVDAALVVNLLTALQRVGATALASATIACPDPAPELHFWTANR